MSVTPVAIKMRAKRLVSRLDACSAHVASGSPMLLHIAVYAGYLTDLIDGRVDAATPQADELVGLVDEFCTLVEAESPLTH